MCDGKVEAKSGGKAEEKTEKVLNYLIFLNYIIYVDYSYIHFFLEKG